MSVAAGAQGAVAYIRLTESRPELAGGSSQATRAQRLAIEAWARRERVEIRSWQADVGVGGATPIAERPGLVAAYGALREVEARILVAADARRFAEDELVAWLIERAALMAGATLRTADGSRSPACSSVDGPRSAEPTAWTRGAVGLARAYHEVTTRSRVRAALAAKRARGERIGTTPYGYRVSADGIHLEPDDSEQAVVATVRRLATEGHSQRAIASQLARMGVAGRTGAPLRQTQVANILRAAR